MKLGHLVLGLAGAGALVAAYLVFSGPSAEPPAKPAVAERAKAPPTPARVNRPDEKRTIVPEPGAAEPEPQAAKPTSFAPDPRELETALGGVELRDAQDDDLSGLPPKLKGGVVLTEVDPRSSAAEAQLAPGDIIVRAHHDDVTRAEELERALADRDHTLLTVYRNGKSFQVVLHKPWKGGPGDGQGSSAEADR